MNIDRYLTIADKFRDRSILVIGDLILDEFVWGKVSRISPEAPVPVVDVQRESYYPGGAANVARNVREFSDSVRVMGLLGSDQAGVCLKKILSEKQILLDALIEAPEHATIVKTRIIARNQQVVRVDRERRANMTSAQCDRVVEKVTELLPHLHGVIFEDYGKGLLSQPLVDRLLDILAGKVIITVDPHPASRLDWRDTSAITPNRLEAFNAAGAAWSDPVDPPLEDAALREVGSILLRKWDSANLLITLGEQGMMLFRDGEEPFHIPTRAQEVFDVSGAGDTAIALLTLALAAGASPTEAAEISNHASGIVVGKLGTATVSPDELQESFASNPA
jgi:rfaE bifunctional protein kinase chain/domain